MTVLQSGEWLMRPCSVPSGRMCVARRHKRGFHRIGIFVVVLGALTQTVDRVRADVERTMTVGGQHVWADFAES
jgi:hypothetical protein